VNKLLIPFLFFYVGSFLLKYTIWIVAPGTFQQPVSWSELLLIFQGHSLIKFNPPIWFLVALFNCNILFYLVHYLRKRVGLMFIAILLIGATGFFLGKKQIVLPLYTDIAMTALPFYAGGFWIRRYNFFLFPHRLDKLIPVIVIFFSVYPLLLFFFTGNAYQSLQRKYLPVVCSSVCRYIFDHAIVQKDQAYPHRFLPGQIFDHHVKYPRTDPALCPPDSCTLSAQRVVAGVRTAGTGPGYFSDKYAGLSETHPSGSSTEEPDPDHKL